MRRREFISIVGGASVLPLAARAQQRPNPVIGYLHIGRADHNAYLEDAFCRGLASPMLRVGCSRQRGNGHRHRK